LDKAVAIAHQEDVTVATFGDMIRVPGSDSSLERARAQGADIEITYSPTEALQYAKDNRERRVVFLGVGFETTAPAIAWTIREAARTGVQNYSVLCGHKTIPPAMAALCESGDLGLDGFMCPGHVSVIIGADAYEPVCQKHRVPCVVTGFEPIDMLQGIERLLRQTAQGRAEVEIQYSRSVRREGNVQAQAIIDEVFEPCDDAWRGLGTIPGSGLRIQDTFRAQDAQIRFEGLNVPSAKENAGCICGQILRGVKTPHDCALFGSECTPATPVGACMVSSEGTCAAYHKYARSIGVME
jgi:hydrogenase expression/formation protein HypD